jgi:hypothetical protein
MGDAPERHGGMGLGVGMADSTYGLAYEEALRGVVQQQAVLTDIRGRAATMLGAAAVSTSFLGGIAASGGGGRG